MGNQEVCREKSTNRGSKPAVRLAPHRAMRRGRAGRSRQEHSNDIAGDFERQEAPEGVNNFFQRGFADDAVKAVSRAQRGRSEAERLERVAADLTIAVDGRAAAFRRISLA
jgi:hypothetical protein